MLWPLQSPELNTAQEWNVKERSPPASKHQLGEYLLEELCFLPLLQLQRLVESMPRIHEGVITQHFTKADQCLITAEFYYMMTADLP